MTKVTIDRDLLERIRELLYIIGHRQDDYGVEAEYLGGLLKKAIAQPAQQGEAVEVVAWLNTLTGDTTSYAVAVMDWDDESEPVQSLMTVAQHQRILAASVPAAQRQRAQWAVGVPEGWRASDYTSLEAELTELRHQHDKLAGLLREAAGELRTDRHHGLRPKIYAALSEIKP